MPFSDVTQPTSVARRPGYSDHVRRRLRLRLSDTSKHVSAWVDGRNAINGSSSAGCLLRQGVGGFSSVISISPACGSFIVGTAPTDFVVSLSDAVNPGTVDATDLTVNGTPANTFVLGRWQHSDNIPFQYLTDGAGPQYDRYRALRIQTRV